MALFICQSPCVAGQLSHTESTGAAPEEGSGSSLGLCEPSLWLLRQDYVPQTLFPVLCSDRVSLESHVA